jgi:hypothetical protein
MPAVFLAFWIVGTVIFWIGSVRGPATAVLAAALTAPSAFVLLRFMLRDRKAREALEPVDRDRRQR